MSRPDREEGKGGPHEHPGADDKKVQVAVQTTSGRWPETGFESVPEQQKIAVAIERAVHALRLADTAGWIVIVAGREVEPQQTYRELTMHGEVVLDFGPRAGGGGHA